MSVVLHEGRGPDRRYTSDERSETVRKFHSAIYSVLLSNGNPKEHPERIGSGMSFRFIRYDSSTPQFVVEDIAGSQLAYLFEWGGRRSKLGIKRTVYDISRGGKQRVDSGMLSPEKAEMLPAIIGMNMGEGMSREDLALLVRETLLLTPAQEVQLLRTRTRVS